MSDRPELTITQAADACGVSKKTIRRRIDAAAFPNARRLDGPAGEASGPWVVPVDDLIAAGLTVGKPSPPDEPPPTVSAAEPAPTESDELAKLRADNAELRRRAEVAEAVADERGRALDDARLALRALTAGPDPVSAAETPPEPEGRRRGWFGRNKR